MNLKSLFYLFLSLLVLGGVIYGLYALLYTGEKSEQKQSSTPSTREETLELPIPQKAPPPETDFVQPEITAQELVESVESDIATQEQRYQEDVAPDHYTQQAAMDAELEALAESSGHITDDNE